jgi:hypothetical protein
MLVCVPNVLLTPPVSIHAAACRILLTTEPLPNLQFALETVTQVQAKVNAMLGQSMWGMAVGFDENEVLILKTALWLYIASLKMIKSITEDTTLLARCQQLARKLDLVKA